uniref:Uncharacterized protein n=1 Tax=Anguilla anguilla TaxID=7936 RepID=A0A0E9X211_ANGAN
MYILNFIYVIQCRKLSLSKQMVCTVAQKNHKGKTLLTLLPPTDHRRHSITTLKKQRHNTIIHSITALPTPTPFLHSGIGTVLIPARGFQALGQSKSLLEKAFLIDKTHPPYLRIPHLSEGLWFVCCVV